MKLLGLGDNVMDAYRYRGEWYPGGNAANTAALAKRAGAFRSGYLGILADDAPGRHFKASLAQEGLDLSRLRIAHGCTACNYIELDAQGDRIFTGNNGSDTVQGMVQLLLGEGDRAYSADFDVVHTSIHSMLDRELPALALRTRLSMDFSNDGFTHINVAQLAPFLSFAFFSAGARGADEVRSFAHYAQSCGVGTVVFTMGTRGAYILEQDREYRQAAFPVEAVDALGAGDAFIAAFLVRYLDSNGDTALSAEYAARFAATCCGHYGAFGHPYPCKD